MEPDNLTLLLDERLGNLVKKDILMLEADKSANEAIRYMKDKNARCCLVMHDKEAVGIVTRTDILFKVVAEKKDPNKIKLREIMSTPVIMLPATATVSDALRVMDKYAIRQVFVGSSSAIVGMISREWLFELIYKVSMNLVEHALSGAPVCIINPRSAAFINDANNLECPYCQSTFTYKEELSRHIDRIHLGSGALEGDLRRIFE